MTQRKINNEYEIKKIEIYQERQRNSLRIEIEKFSKKISILESKFIEATGLQKDSLGIEISKLNENLNYRQEQIN